MIRVCAIQATTSVATALQISDGGTVIWQVDAQVGGGGLQLGGLDIRAMTTGNLGVQQLINRLVHLFPARGNYAAILLGEGRGRCLMHHSDRLGA